jgi:hypothetical protein
MEVTERKERYVLSPLSLWERVRVRVGFEFKFICSYFTPPLILAFSQREKGLKPKRFSL